MLRKMHKVVALGLLATLLGLNGCGGDSQKTAAAADLSASGRVALDHHILIDLLAHKTKRPGPYRMLPEIPPAPFRNNPDRPCRKIGQQKVVRVLQVKNHCPLVRSLNLIH